MQLNNNSMNKESRARTLENTDYSTYKIGNSVYEITRSFGKEKTLKELIMERIAGKINDPFS